MPDHVYFLGAAFQDGAASRGPDLDSTDVSRVVVVEECSVELLYPLAEANIKSLMNEETEFLCVNNNL